MPVHHPWHWLRDHLPDWTVHLVPLPAGVWGLTNVAGKVILLERELLQVQRRCTLDHELLHAEAGDVGEQHPARERQVEELSARRLVPLEQLVEAAIWAHDVAELADECWVDLPTMRCRLDTLTDHERQRVREAIAIRDWHQEAMP